MIGFPSRAVLTEPSLCVRCHQMDDFSPAKNLMTMCFTYYYIGKGAWLEMSPVHGKGVGGVSQVEKSPESM